MTPAQRIFMVDTTGATWDTDLIVIASSSLRSIAQELFEQSKVFER